MNIVLKPFKKKYDFFFSQKMYIKNNFEKKLINVFRQIFVTMLQ